MIAHLKDQLQEMKAKTSMEKKYIKKVCTVSVSQTQKMCNMGEKQLKDEIEVSGCIFLSGTGRPKKFLAYTCTPNVVSNC